jgi:uncharacterized repeat protein (TIGR01451 family)
LFKVTVANTGGMTLTNVKVAASFAADSTVTKMTEGGKQFRDQVVWTIPKLAPGDGAKEFRFWLKAPTTGRKTVRATAIDARGTTHSTSAESVFQGTADLVWETSFDQTRVAVDTSGMFTILVKNIGSEPAKNVVVRVKIPDEIKSTMISPAFNQGGNEIAFQAVSIAAGKSEKFSVTFRGAKAGQATFGATLMADCLGEKGLSAEKAVTVTSNR